MQTKGIILDNIKEIEKVFEENSVQKPFLCCSNSFKKTNEYKYLKDNFNLSVWDKIRPNPRYEDMVLAKNLFIENDCDFIIGAGGGSPLDSAKMIKLLVTNDEKTALTAEMKDNNIPFLAIPTTAGTGSEATKYSIFYVNENEKHSKSHEGFLPNYVILDEKFLQTLPPYQKRCTMMDALCHAIESYWNVKSSDESKEIAKRAIILVKENMDAYLENDIKASKNMMEASYLAGKAINITATTSAHAMCYNITINCHTAHGHSVSLNLAEIWKYMLENNSEVNDKRGQNYVLKTLDEIGTFLGGKDRFDGAKIFESYLEKLELYTPKMEKSKVSAFAKSVNVSRLLNNPTTLKTEDVLKIYYNVFKIK